MIITAKQPRGNPRQILRHGSEYQIALIHCALLFSMHCVPLFFIGFFTFYRNSTSDYFTALLHCTVLFLISSPSSLQCLKHVIWWSLSRYLHRDDDADRFTKQTDISDDRLALIKSHNLLSQQKIKRRRCLMMRMMFRVKMVIKVMMVMTMFKVMMMVKIRRTNMLMTTAIMTQISNVLNECIDYWNMSAIKYMVCYQNNDDDYGYDCHFA